ncbi:MAG: SufD family Fe-S cluster assembly protein, partial [Leptospiraceae bacterium]|nr:SufD family Fe-S cluster assembly protein [Leptospiraceae bacterium]
STIGEVDEEQMFYLLSRGLTEQEARHLIIEGFFSEVLDKISSESLRNNLNFRLLKKLNV